VLLGAWGFPWSSSRPALKTASLLSEEGLKMYLEQHLPLEQLLQAAVATDTLIKTVSGSQDPAGDVVSSLCRKLPRGGVDHAPGARRRGGCGAPAHTGWGKNI
jgi:hypothetical protein